MKNIWNRGDLFIWLTGTALACSLIMVAGLLLCVLVNATQFFWPGEIVRFSLADGTSLLGVVTAREEIPDPENPTRVSPRYRLQLKRGNRDLYGNDFVWMDEASIKEKQIPLGAVIVERREWGDFYGWIEEVRENGRVIARGPKEGLRTLQEKLPQVAEIHQDIQRIQKKEIGAINHHLENTKLELKKLASKGITRGEKTDRLEQAVVRLHDDYKKQEAALNRLRRGRTAEAVFMTVDGREKTIPLFRIVRVYMPNTFGLMDRIAFFFAKVWEFVYDDPREANTEGGVFPALFGTVLMVLVMSLMATPLGVLAGFYLREYARQGAMVSMVRIAVNNLAGVPSIVFGVFGVGFFIYLIGGSIDQLFFSESLPTPTFGTGGLLWASLTMALLTVPVVIVSTEEGLAAVPGGIREASLALGATRFETIWRVVLPAVMPSILTGLILAMARAAGEVAPLMITGVVKLAPDLPIDGLWPFIHLERKFMHLGFHIYDVGFQSPNVDAARPMVFTTTLLLIALVLFLNLSAIFLRNRLRRKLAVAGL